MLNNSHYKYLSCSSLQVPSLGNIPNFSEILEHVIIKQTKIFCFYRDLTQTTVTSRSNSDTVTNGFIREFRHLLSFAFAQTWEDKEDSKQKLWNADSLILRQKKTSNAHHHLYALKRSPRLNFNLPLTRKCPKYYWKMHFITLFISYYYHLSNPKHVKSFMSPLRDQYFIWTVLCRKTESFLCNVAFKFNPRMSLTVFCVSPVI